MKYIPSYIALLLSAVFFFAAWQNFRPFTFAPGGTITVEGTSSVHDWSCTATDYAGHVDSGTNAAVLESIEAGSLLVPVSGIDCRNGTMNGKVRDALKAKQHSSIRYTLTSARVTPAAGGKLSVNATGKLTIAGSTQNVQIQATAEPAGDGRYRITGSVPITMSQFGIAPPTAMLGTLRTGDAITVRFNLVAAL